MYKSFVSGTGMTFNILSSIASSRAPAVIGGKNVLDASCNNDESFPKFIMYPCSIRLEILCSEVLPVKHVLGTVTNIVNSIRAAPLQHRLFRQLSENVEPAYPDVICNEVRWLSKGKILELF